MRGAKGLFVLGLCLALGGAWAVAGPGPEDARKAGDAGFRYSRIRNLGKSSREVPKIKKVAPIKLSGFLDDLPDLRPILKTRCELHYDGSFSPAKAVGSNPGEACHEALEDCRFWAKDKCDEGKWACTNMRTGLPIPMELIPCAKKEPGQPTTGMWVCEASCRGFPNSEGVGDPKPSKLQAKESARNKMPFRCSPISYICERMEK